ncbi:MAG: urate hydroxylase PuuD [Albidovulum sp.]|nr:urate hydroxylase PuuD [Albidovulum sp.]MDE0306561.1 urate hydroxylase PuuD [Albidovulum sp.]
MYDFAVIVDWLTFAVRWFHVVAGIAWIGSSFYFIALDLGLRKYPYTPEKVGGEQMQIHGGGFYRMQKYTVAPDNLPEHLVWFKWEAYSTWLSGFVLLALIYYLGADLYLVDTTKLNISANAGILISIASIGLGWVLYDFVCKSPLGKNAWLLQLTLFAILVAMAWGYDQVFTGRAALLHLGAFTATIMSANVFFIIIPNQKIVIADLVANRTPDVRLGEQAKQRSTHNNYLTLPVLFLMLANHYPLSFGTEYSWMIASLVFLMGVTIRHFFNTMHSGKGKPLWTWLATALVFIAIMWLSTFRDQGVESETSALSPALVKFANAAGFSEVHELASERCSLCHAREPLWEGMHWAPKGVWLETEADIAKHAREIYLQAGLSHAMPPAGLVFLEPSERQLIVDWYKNAIGDINS